MNDHRALPSGQEIQYDPRHETYAVGWDDETVDPAAYTVVELVATLKGVELTALDPLANHVDVDALGRLFEPARRSGSPAGVVTFEYEGYVVEIHPGRITASPA
jgi:hypothetical protein